MVRNDHVDAIKSSPALHRATSNVSVVLPDGIIWQENESQMEPTLIERSPNNKQSATYFRRPAAPPNLIIQVVEPTLRNEEEHRVDEPTELLVNPCPTPASSITITTPRPTTSTKGSPRPRQNPYFSMTPPPNTGLPRIESTGSIVMALSLPPSPLILPRSPPPHSLPRSPIVLLPTPIITSIRSPETPLLYKTAPSSPYCGLEATHMELTKEPERESAQKIIPPPLLHQKQDAYTNDHESVQPRFTPMIAKSGGTRFCFRDLAIPPPPSDYQKGSCEQQAPPYSIPTPHKFLPPTNIAHMGGYEMVPMPQSYQPSPLPPPRPCLPKPYIIQHHQQQPLLQAIHINQSPPVKENVSPQSIQIVVNTGSQNNLMPCPKCRKGFIVRKRSRKLNALLWTFGLLTLCCTFCIPTVIGRKFIYYDCCTRCSKDYGHMGRKKTKAMK